MTDNELKQLAAKMLPSTLRCESINGLDGKLASVPLWFFDPHYPTSRERLIDDTQMLHVCHLIENTLSDGPEPARAWAVFVINLKIAFFGKRLLYPEASYIHSSWQHRIIALAKTKGLI